MSDIYNFRKFINNGRLKKTIIARKKKKNKKNCCHKEKISHNKILSILYGP